MGLQRVYRAIVKQHGQWSSNAMPQRQRTRSGGGGGLAIATRWRAVVDDPAVLIRRPGAARVTPVAGQAIPALVAEILATDRIAAFLLHEGAVWLLDER